MGTGVCKNTPGNDRQTRARSDKLVNLAAVMNMMILMLKNTSMMRWRLMMMIVEGGFCLSWLMFVLVMMTLVMLGG